MFIYYIAYCYNKNNIQHLPKEKKYHLRSFLNAFNAEIPLKTIIIIVEQQTIKRAAIL